MPTHPLLASLPPSALERLDAMAAQHADAERRLADPDVAIDHRAARDLAVRKAALEPVVSAYTRLRKLAGEAADLADTAAGTDPDLASLAREELPTVEAAARALLDQVKRRLVTTDDQRVGSVILEVRAGTGGDEATLWARDLLDMYQRYAARRAWTFELLDLATEPSVGGVRAATASIRGEGAWAHLAFEAGVHSVKRVPATESQGRIHTSTATVAVLPEPEEVEVKVDWAADVVEHLTTAQGPGGQNVNKVTTACHLIHTPTGIEVRMQESKSLQQNRERARRLLLARLYELEQQKRHAERSAARRSQIGGAGRSEKLRTYRYKEGIVADERLPGQYQLQKLLAGDLDQLFADLTEQEIARRLAEL